MKEHPSQLSATLDQDSFRRCALSPPPPPNLDHNPLDAGSLAPRRTRLHQVTVDSARQAGS